MQVCDARGVSRGEATKMAKVTTSRSGIQDPAIGDRGIHRAKQDAGMSETECVRARLTAIGWLHRRALQPPHLYEDVRRSALRGGHLELLDDVEVACLVDADGGDGRGEGHSCSCGRGEGRDTA